MNDQFRLQSSPEAFNETPSERLFERTGDERGPARKSGRGDGLVWTLLGVSIAVNAAFSATGLVVASAAVGTLVLGLATVLVVRYVKRSR